MARSARFFFGCLVCFVRFFFGVCFARSARFFFRCLVCFARFFFGVSGVWCVSLAFSGVWYVSLAPLATPRSRQELLRCTRCVDRPARVLRCTRCVDRIQRRQPRALTRLNSVNSPALTRLKASTAPALTRAGADAKLHAHLESVSAAIPTDAPKLREFPKRGTLQ